MQNYREKRITRYFRSRSTAGAACVKDAEQSEYMYFCRNRGDVNLGNTYAKYSAELSNGLLGLIVCFVAGNCFKEKRESV